MGELKSEEVLKQLDDYRDLLEMVRDVLIDHRGIEVTRPDGELVIGCKICKSWTWPCMTFSVAFHLMFHKGNNHG